MFTRLLLWGSYIFLLLVLLPHTAWQFSLFEPNETRNLGWAAAVAFELTIGALTHFLAREIAAVADISNESLGVRVKRELANIPSFLLLTMILVSTIANWTHAFIFGEAVPYGEYTIVRLVYSMLFGAVLPLCSFAFAYVLSKAYRKDKPATGDQDVAAWMALVEHVRSNSNRDLTPRYLSRIANVDEGVASKVIAEAARTGVLNGKQ